MLKYAREYRLADMRQMHANNRAAPLESVSRLDGMRCVITGCTSGVGWEAAKRLAAFGAQLLMINRNQEKSAKACDKLQSRFGVQCSYLLADFSNLDAVREAAQAVKSTWDRVDLLINNIGMHSTKLTRTACGHETVFCVNHLAPFLLTWELLESLKRGESARIIQVNSQGHRFGGLDPTDLDWKRRHYTGLRGYGASKTAQLLTVWEFADMLEDSSVTIIAMHPGAVRSNIGSNNGPLYRWFKDTILSKSLADPSISGVAIHYLASAPELATVSGKYFNLTHPEKPAPHALDREVGRAIWHESLRLVGIE